MKSEYHDTKYGSMPVALNDQFLSVRAVIVLNVKVFDLLQVLIEEVATYLTL